MDRLFVRCKVGQLDTKQSHKRLSTSAMKTVYSTNLNKVTRDYIGQYHSKGVCGIVLPQYFCYED